MNLFLSWNQNLFAEQRKERLKFFIALLPVEIQLVLISIQIIEDMSQQNVALQGQKAMMQAIEEYIDRHNTVPGGEGPKDLRTLQACGAEKLYQAFGSNPETGLSSAQVEENGRKYGINEYMKRSRRTLCQIFKEAICDELLVILIIAAIISVVVEYFAGEEKDMFWVDGVSIMIAVIVCTLVSTVSNYQKERQFDELDKMTQSTYNYEVLRDGKRQQVHRTKIVPGDMIFLTNGMEIPADCLLYRAVNVIGNQSAITGQSHELYKNTIQKCLEQKMDPKGPTPIMISGANVVSGEGIMMATVVGKDSRAGKNFQLIFSKDEQVQATALQRQLEKLASQIGRIGIIAAIFIFVVLVARLVIEQIHKGGFNFKENLEKLVNYLIIAVTVVVVSIPEGLPLAVTLTLAYSMKAMHKDKILVRKLQSCETMGGATFLCSDKTGTITQNKMTVMHVVNTKEMPISQFTVQEIHPQYLQLLKNAVFHNTSAIVETGKGAQTEIALLKMARDLTQLNEEQFRKQVGPDAYFKRLPFDSSRKRMTTGMRVGNQDVLFMNGASEQILAASNSILDYKSNQVQPLTPQLKNKIEEELYGMAKKGLRTVSIAYKYVNSKDVSRSALNREKDVLQQIEKSGFTMLGVFGIEDPPRAQSKQAIENCKKAGIKVIMVTGDNKVTAENISHQVGIMSQGNGNGKIMEASQFIKALEDKGLLKQEPPKLDKNGKPIPGSSNKLKKVIMENEADQRAFEEVVGDLVVMARSKPEHKYVLVDGINKLGHIVGVTGDGANDAPALMRADIGLAMGITGTQVSKNASDIIILDDNFNSIVNAVVWGRNVYTSIRKFLQFQLTVNIIAVCIVLVSAAIIRQSVLASVQMLWVNLIMDSLAALALATEPPNREQLLNQSPNSPDERLITKTMLKHIIGQAIFQLCVLLTLLFVGPSFIPEYRDGFDDVIGQDLQAKYFHGAAETTVADGKFYFISGEENYKVWYDKYHNHSRHFTFLFNTFVFLQVFNFICCRRIKDEINIFSNICSSKLFWIIVFLIVILQVLVVTFLGRFFQLYQYRGLNITQWLISVGIGALTIPVSLFLRLLPCCKHQDHRGQRRVAQLEDDELNEKSIQTTNRKYILPVSAYSSVSGLPFTKLSSKKSSKRVSQTESKPANLPYGYQYNTQFNQPRPY